jgi:hypothetical protein
MLWLLFQYTSVGKAVAERTRGVEEMAANYERAHYANLVASDNRGGRREEMFASRERKAIDEAGNAKWPFHNPRVKTAKDADSMYSVVGRVALQHKASVFRKAGGPRRESDPALLILLLTQKYAERHGVKLGIHRVIALACCAGNWSPDPHTVHDFFSTREMQIAADTILSRCEPFLDTLPTTGL